MQTIIREYISQNTEEAFRIIKELCGIPAPSHFEHERAAWCKAWLDENCGEGAYIDEALNVIYPVNCEGKDAITVIVAHTDTVFPDRTPMPYHDDGEKICSPGVADDTASVAVLLLTAKFFVEQDMTPKNGVMFVCNSCEEGLGNLKGTKQLFREFDGRIGRFISFDSQMNTINDRCVGSRRYEVEVQTVGGHSFSAFGNENAIARLSQIVTEIYKLKVPQRDGATTTYNVGTIEGGTSVNTIAQSAKMLCEYRSDDKRCMAIMQENFERIFEAARWPGVQVNVKQVGDRPCGDIADSKIEELRRIAVPIVEGVTGEKVTLKSSSTDCNVPLSLGIPALCVGITRFFGAHTRQEWLDKASVIPGLEIAIKTALAMSVG